MSLAVLRQACEGIPPPTLYRVGAASLHRDSTFQIIGAPQRPLVGDRGKYE
jgi:hypothetical protein